MEENNRDNRGYRSMAIIALLVAVAGISVAFAALSQTLIINATGKVKGSSWDIHWSAASCTKTGGTLASCGTSSPLTLGKGVTTITISDIVLEKPGDKVEWVVEAKNGGDIDAILGTFTDLFTKTVTFAADETKDTTHGGTLSANDVIVTLTKNPSGTVASGDELLALASAPANTQEYLLKIEFNPSATDVPEKDVTVNVVAQFPWVQK